LNQVFETSIDNLRQYFDLSDFLISLYYIAETTVSPLHTATYLRKEMQRVQTFILARNFEQGLATADYEKAYRSRIIGPLLNLL